jgi:hypothetical protein
MTRVRAARSALPLCSREVASLSISGEPEASDLAMGIARPDISYGFFPAS